MESESRNKLNTDLIQLLMDTTVDKQELMNNIATNNFNKLTANDDHEQDHDQDENK